MKIEKEGKQAAASTANLSHAEAVEAAQVVRLRMKSHIKAGYPIGRPPPGKPNHNEVLVRDEIRGLKLKTRVRAGGPSSKPGGTIRR